MGPLGWLAPALLAALGALAVPVLLHLLKRERRQVVEFPSLMFLRRIPQETTRRRRIRHPLLLALRCLALALLAIAFARPFLRDRLAALPVVREARDVVILLDRSYSMGYADRWSRAVAAAGQEIDALQGEDRAAVVLFDDRADAATALTGDHALLRASISAATRGDGATRYVPAFRLARDILVESERARREVVIVSDFQRAGWSGNGDDMAMPPGTLVRRVDMSDGGLSDPPSNVAMAGVDLARSDLRGREALSVSARLRSSGAAATTRSATLELNGRAMQTVQVELPPNGTAVARFEPQALPPGVVRGSVRLDPDVLAVDDTANFVAARPRTLEVLVVRPAGAAGRASLFMDRALSLASDPSYSLTMRSPGELTASDIDGRALVILDDVAPPTGEAGRRLATHLRDGGGVIVAMGEQSRRARWDGPLAAIAPLGVGAVRDRGAAGLDGAATIGSVDRGHAIFAPFRDARDGGFGAHVFRYRELRPDTGGRVLARFDDGMAAVVEQAVGRGRLLAWASSLDDGWTDLPLQPSFLPFVHEMARYAAGGTVSVPWTTVGSRLDVARYASELSSGGTSDGGGGGAGTGWLAMAPSGERSTLAPGEPLEVREAGVYELRALTAGGAGSGGDGPIPLAVNVDPAEGDLAALDSAAFTTVSGSGEAAGPGQATRADDALAASISDMERESRQGLWWPLLALAALLLAAEPMLANRLSQHMR